MPLNCQFQADPTTYVQGQVPSSIAPPSISLIVSNPGATAVSVTGVDMQLADRSLNPRPPVGPLPVPTSSGQSLTVAPSATVTFGPFPMSRWTPAVLNPSAMIPPDSSPLGVGGVPQYEAWISGVVYASDGSANVAGRARVLVAPSNLPTRSYLGGNVDFSVSGDSPLSAAVL